MPLRAPPDEPALRRPRARATPEELRAANLRRSWKELEMRIAANFTPGRDIVGCVTFDPAHDPRDRLHAQAKFYYYRSKINKVRLAQGLPRLKAVWGVEVLTSKRHLWHVHFVVDSVGRDYDMLRACWPYGSDCEFDTLQLDPDCGLTKIAKYLSKEPREVQDWKSRAGLHGWSSTRNCVRPTVEVIRVPGDYQLRAPGGCAVFLDETRGGEFGEIREIEYYAKG